MRRLHRPGPGSSWQSGGSPLRRETLRPGTGIRARVAQMPNRRFLTAFGDEKRRHGITNPFDDLEMATDRKGEDFVDDPETGFVESVCVRNIFSQAQIEARSRSSPAATERRQSPYNPKSFLTCKLFLLISRSVRSTVEALGLSPHLIALGSPNTTSCFPKSFLPSPFHTFCPANPRRASMVDAPLFWNTPR